MFSKNFLIEYLPPEQITSPQRAHELAVRFENHVATTTTTKVRTIQASFSHFSFLKEQYQGLIAERLRQIKSKAEQSGRVPSSSSSSSNSSSAAPSAQSTPSSASQTQSQQQSISLSPAEIAQINTTLTALRPQIPQIDKLIQLHTKMATAPEVSKKLIELRNVLVNQIDLAAQKKSYFLNLAQLNLLTDQIQKLSAHLNARLKEEKTKNTQPQTKPPASLSIEKIISQRLSMAEDIPAVPASLQESLPARFLSFNEEVDLRHWPMRNRFLDQECKRLTENESFCIFQQPEAFGKTSLLVHDLKTGFIFTFLLPAQYPSTPFLYRIEAEEGPALLPSKLEPTQMPFCFSTILRRHRQLQIKQL